MTAALPPGSRIPKRQNVQSPLAGVTLDRKRRFVRDGCVVHRAVDLDMSDPWRPPVDKLCDHFEWDDRGKLPAERTSA